MPGLGINPQAQTTQQLHSMLTSQALVLTKAENGLKLKGVGKFEYAIACLLSCIGIHYVTNSKQIDEQVIQFLDKNKEQFNQEDIASINLLRDKILTGSKKEDHSALKRCVSEIELAVRKATTSILKTKPLQSPHLEPPTKADIEVHLRKEQSGKEISVPVGKPFAIELQWSPSTGYSRWEMSELPSFLTQQEELSGDTHANQREPDWVGGGFWAVFVIVPTKAGKGDITLKMPWPYSSGNDETHTFTINAY